MSDWYKTAQQVTDEADLEEIETRQQEIKTRLIEIDSESARPLRAIAAGTATEHDRQKLEVLEREAETLRAE